jgi:hypothetical protein
MRFFCSFELNGLFDKHQEQNARRKAGRLSLALRNAVAI